MTEGLVTCPTCKKVVPDAMFCVYCKAPLTSTAHKNGEVIKK